MLHREKSYSFTATPLYDVIIVGAGPYGLSTAAHLRTRGLRVALFGKPLGFWQKNMPEGMLLRSYWWASNLSDPQKKYTMARYFAAQGQAPEYPLPIQSFIDYGLWFQRNAVPDVDETYISTLDSTDALFTATLEDGRRVQSYALVMATGLNYYAYRPAEYAHLAPEFVSHSSEHSTLDGFTGKKVVVVGGGQSALESAALLHEKGATVELVSRSPIRWLTETPVEQRTLLQKLRSPNAGIAPGWFNWCLEHFPSAFQHLSRSRKEQILRGRGRYGPAGSGWLKPRLTGNVVLHEGDAVNHVREAGTGVVLHLTNGTEIQGDHVLLATGYHVDIGKLPMFHPTLVSHIRTFHNAPLLNDRFECSVPGLYFVGIAALASCGPLYRFVVGTDATARRVADDIAHQMYHYK